VTVTLEHLLTLECELLRRRQEGDPDDYGNPGWEVVDDEQLPCELQQEQSYEAEGGVLEISLWRLFLPATAPPAGWDAVRVDDVVYELEGDAWLVRNPRTTVDHHVEARVRRIR
jgi:hypothetical protein